MNKYNDRHNCCENDRSTLRKGATYKWKTVNRKYKNFTDLGDYVIDCDRHRNFDFEKARRYTAKRYDYHRFMGCTALAVKSFCGDVLIGRNLDLTISQLPCYRRRARQLRTY